MKSIMKALGVILICFVGLFFALTAYFTANIPKNISSASPTPKPTISEEEVEDLGKRYYTSHIKMKWSSDQFYGGKLTQESANKLMRQCFDTFEDKDRCESVVNEQFWIGMTSLWATMSLGNPNDINETATGDFTREQWVYGDPIYGATYLYFDNDILTSYQK